MKKTGKKSMGICWSILESNNLALSSLPIHNMACWKIQEQQSSEQEDLFQKFFTERGRCNIIKGVNQGENVLEETDALEDAKNREANIDGDTDEEEEEFIQNLALTLMEGLVGEVVNFSEYRKILYSVRDDL